MAPSSFVTDHIYHIYNRGVEKREVFLDMKDYRRFILNLYEFNDASPALNFGRNLAQTRIEVRLQSPRKDPPVKLLAFCLMPNHFHLMVQQQTDGGITQFMRKLGTGYTNYFNIKYNRVGALFQGKFKAVLLERDAHLVHLPHYIHLNPLDLFMPEWREHRIKDIEKAMNFLRAYRWSSFPDYIGKNNFSSVSDRKFLTEYIGTPNAFLNATREWIWDTQFDFIQKVTLE